MHSPYSDGQPVHPYQAGTAHTHHACIAMPPSVGYLHSVKISAYHTNVPYNNQPYPSGSLTSVKREQDEEGEGISERAERGVRGEERKGERNW